MKDPKKTKGQDDETPRTSKPKKEKPTPAAEETRGKNDKGLKYQFKFAPADPKNNLDFIGEYLGLGRKVKNPGWEMWEGCIAGEKKSPLFLTLDRKRRLTAERITRNDVLRMIKRRARTVRLPVSDSVRPSDRMDGALCLTARQPLRDNK